MYSARFGDRDILHRVWWVAFGVACAGMLANSGLPSDDAKELQDFSAFAAFVACERIVLGLLYARVASHLPEVRGFAATKAFEYICVNGIFWIVMAVIPHYDGLRLQLNTCLGLSLVPVLMNLFGVVPYIAFQLKLAKRVRICLDPAKARFGQLMTIQKGILVVSVATSVRGKWSEFPECYVIAGCAVVIAVLMNVQHAWVNNVPNDRHAVTQSVRARNMWLGLQLANLTSVLICATGFKRMLTQHVQQKEDSLGQKLAAFGVSGMLFVAVALDLIHNPPFRSLRPSNGTKESEEMDGRFIAREVEEQSESCWQALGQRRTRRITTNVIGMVISACLFLCSAVVEACLLAVLTVVLVAMLALDKQVTAQKSRKDLLADVA